MGSPVSASWVAWCSFSSDIADVRYTANIGMSSSGSHHTLVWTATATSGEITSTEKLETSR